MKIQILLVLLCILCGGGVIFCDVRGYNLFYAHILLLLSLVGFTVYFFMRRRSDRRTAELYRILPGRIGVINREGRLLFLKMENGDLQNIKVPRMFSDISGFDYPVVFGAMQEVFRTGKFKMVEYDFRSVKRVLRIMPVPKHLFGEDAVLWISHDNSELQNLRANYTVLLDNMPSFVYTMDIDRDFRYVSCNKAFLRIHGLQEKDIIGKNDFELFSRERAAEYLRSNTEVAKHGGLQEEILPYILGNGTTRIGRFFRKRLDLPDGRHLLFGLGTDITEQTELMENQKVLNECFADILANENGDPGLPVVRAICRRLNAFRCCLLRFDHVRHMMEMNSMHPDRSPEGRSYRGHPFSEDELWYRLFLKGEMISAPDVSDAGTIRKFGLWREENIALGISSLYVLPVIVNGKLWGSLEVTYNGRIHVLTECEKDFFSSCARLSGLMAGRMLDRSRITASLERLRDSVAMMESGAQLTQSAFFRFDPETRHVEGTQGMEKLLPCRNGTVLSMKDWVSASDWPICLQKIKNLRDGLSPFETFDFHSEYFGGRRYYRMLLVRSPEGNYSGALQNVTEIVDTAAKLKESQELWETVINAIPSMFFAKDADNEFRYAICNHAFADFLGLPVQSIIGRTDPELVHPLNRISDYLEKDREIMKVPGGSSFEENYVDGHGTTHNIQVTKIPFVSQSGHHLLLGACHDVTELHELLRHEKITSEVLSSVVPEPDLARAVDRIFATLMRTLHYDRAIMAYAAPDSSFRFFREAFSEHNVPLAATGLPVHEKLWGTHFARFRKNLSVLYNDLTTVPEFREFHETHPDYPTKSLAAVPFFIGGELAGILITSFMTPRNLTPADERILRAMASVISLAVIRDRQNRAIQQAELRNTLILDTVNVPIWLYDSSGVILQTNKAVAGLAGNNRLGQQPFACRLTHGGCAYFRNQCPIQLALRDGTPHREPYTDSVNGHDYIIEARPAFDASGKIVNVVKCALEVTQLNHLIANLRVLNDSLGNILRETDMRKAMGLSLKGICDRLGASRCYIFSFDTAAKTISCFSEYDPSGMTSVLGRFDRHPYSATPDWEQRFAEHPLISIPDLAKDCEAEGLSGWKPYIREFEARSVYARRLLLKGKFWGYLGVIYQHEPHVLTEENLNFLDSAARCIELMLISLDNQQRMVTALEQARAAEKAKSAFLASMSHEIRTPLNAVIGFAELLRDGTLPPDEQKDYVSCISSAGNTLLALINDVLDLSKLEAGQMVFTPAEVDFRALVSEVGAIFRAKCREKKLEFRQEIPETMPHILADRLRLRQLLFNLVGNAVKFTDRGSITVSASFVPEDGKSGTFSFHVKDTGIGISPDDQKKIFQMFVQAEAIRGTQAAKNGTGLGLAICRRMIEKMNGKIELESVPGKGSDFIVTLPGTPCCSPAESSSSSADPGQQPKSGKVPPCSVLLVDDVPMNLKVMSAMLKSLGISPLTAANAKEAEEILEKHPVDFLLTDLWMPGKNGAELANLLRHDPRFAKLRIAAVTADAESGDSFNMSMFDSILTKPVTVEKMRNFLLTPPRS